MKDRYPPKKNICRICNSMGETEWHHIISQHRCKKINPKLIYNRGNIYELCKECHDETTASLIKQNKQNEKNYGVGTYIKRDDDYLIRVVAFSTDKPYDKCEGDIVSIALADKTAQIIELGKFVKTEESEYLKRTVYLYKRKRVIVGWKDESE